eukprot:CFRG3593T1
MNLRKESVSITNATECGRGFFDTSCTQSQFQTNCEHVRESHGTDALWRYMYECCLCSGYISEERLAYNIIYNTSSANAFGVPLQVTINRSKPEIIAEQAEKSCVLARGAQCVICFENVSSKDKPGLRAYEFVLNGRNFFAQYPPYPYCSGHAVVIELEHTAQIITCDTIADLLDFAGDFPNRCINSNTDKSGTGASILQHRHYQVTGMKLPIYSAPIEPVPYQVNELVVSVVHYPAVAVRLDSKYRDKLAQVATNLLDVWRSREYCAAEGYILEDQTMSFSVLNENGSYTMIMLPRNVQSQTNPNMHCIKREFVGVLEMAGYAVLPARLYDELHNLECTLASMGMEKVVKGTYELPNELEIFRPFVDRCWVKAREKSNEDSSCTHEQMVTALHMAFADIIMQNAPYDSRDKAHTRRLVSQALQKI